MILFNEKFISQIATNPLQFLKDVILIKVLNGRRYYLEYFWVILTIINQEEVNPGIWIIGVIIRIEDI